MKKKFRNVILFLISVLLISSCTINKPAEKERTITVSGTGTVSVKPDLVYLKFIIKTMDWNVSKAVEKNSVNTTNVINAIKDIGIDSNDIATADYKINQDNTKDYPGQYTVINTLGVVVRNIDLVGKVIDVAIKDKTGANGLTAFNYEVTDKTTALREARTLAVKNAQDSAALLAGASGCRVGSVVDIYENYSSFYQKRGEDFGYSSISLKAVPIEEDIIDVTSNITIKFNLEQ